MKIELAALILSIICAAPIFVFAQMKNPEMIFKTDETFLGYVVEGDKFFVITTKDFGTNNPKSYMYQFVNKQFKKADFDDSKIEGYIQKIKNVYTKLPDNPEQIDNKISINQNEYVELVPLYTLKEKKLLDAGGTNSKIFAIVKDGQKIILSKQYMVTLDAHDFYVDIKNGKIYFYAVKLMPAKNGELGSRQNRWGIFVLDIKNKAFDEIRTEPNLSVEEQEREKHYIDPTRVAKNFIDPIRVPNTPYLLYHTNETIYHGDFLDGDKEMGVVKVPDTEFWIQEIEDWKN